MNKQQETPGLTVTEQSASTYITQTQLPAATPVSFSKGDTEGIFLDISFLRNKKRV